MERLRDYLVLLAVFAAFAFSLVLFRRVIGSTSAWFGLMLMLDFLGLVAFARPLIRLRLPGFLRIEREWEKNGGLYKALRVPAFGALLRRTPLRHLNPLVYLKENPNYSIVQAQIESAEAAHFLAAALLVPYTAFAGIEHQWRAVACLMLVQLSFNLYPILHLRWVRLRVNRLRQRGQHHQLEWT
jgi:Glycosyl-4,4'-diaponeurosporenoate acyltransferase